MIKLLLLTLISIDSLISPITSTDTSNDVNWWCNKSTIPQVCKDQFKTHSSNSSLVFRNESEFRKKLVEITIEKAFSALFPYKHLAKKSRNDKEKVAWVDCLKHYENTIDQLNRTITIDPHRNGGDFDAQIWLTAALTYLDTCKDGLNRIGASSSHFKLVNVTNTLSNLISITLSVNKVSSENEVQSHQKDGYPHWVSASDRRLLRAKSPQPHTKFVVSKHGQGEGHYQTIMEAIDAAEKLKRKTGRLEIHIKAGIYNEIVRIGKHLSNVRLIGEGIGKTIITGNRSTKHEHHSLRETATVGVDGDRFFAQGITFRNTAGPENHRAVALRSSSDKSVFYQCSFEGYQDTLYVHSMRQFYRECEISGTVDFIFGNALAVFQKCKIYVRRGLPNQSHWITAQGKQRLEEASGISIHHSTVEPASDLRPFLRQHKTYLGRPWKKYSTTVYLKTYLHGFIDPEGWSGWNKTHTYENTVYFGEYSNTGGGSSTARRVKWRGYHLIKHASEALQFTVEKLIDGLSWLPAVEVPFHPGL
ncbi:hypothetical protein AQUCO_01300581v1 [Aquilegia coerulea]|uniref:Pectinesterase n=1 Tax=Aquilegia coerulea TaxID=218851 RepID=A0A2G5E2E2_AQUCA|nr:hypothetical protein AQUCO_01300581v1 [Aquilegia coerulea]